MRSLAVQRSESSGRVSQTSFTREGGFEQSEKTKYLDRQGVTAAYVDHGSGQRWVHGN